MPFDCFAPDDGLTLTVFTNSAQSTSGAVQKLL
jgi:hypothetical protein